MHTGLDLFTREEQEVAVSDVRTWSFAASGCACSFRGRSDWPWRNVGAGALPTKGSYGSGPDLATANPQCKVGADIADSRRRKAEGARIFRA